MSWFRLPGFGGSKPATPQPTQQGPDLDAQRKAAEEIASRNQGSSRRAEFTKKQRASLLLNAKEDGVNLG